MAPITKDGEGMEILLVVDLFDEYDHITSLKLKHLHGLCPEIHPSLLRLLKDAGIGQQEHTNKDTEKYVLAEPQLVHTLFRIGFTMERFRMDPLFSTPVIAQFVFNPLIFTWGTNLPMLESATTADVQLWGKSTGTLYLLRRPYKKLDKDMHLVVSLTRNSP